MENQKFQKVIKHLQRIEPNPEFLAKSKQIIFRAEQEPARPKILWRMFEGINVRTAFAMASVVLVAVVSSAVYFSNSTSRLTSSLNDQAIAREATSMHFEIQIAEASYFDDSAEKVAMALDKIAASKVQE